MGTSGVGAGVASTRSTGESSENVRAITLALLMVLSAIVMPLTAGGTAAAAGPDESGDWAAVEHTATAPASSLAANGATRAATGDQNETVPGETDEKATVEGSEERNVTTVTLITGERVTIVESGGETHYKVEGASTEMRRKTTRAGTYIYPASVDFSTFDRSLFNVDLLRQQNLTDEESGSIPVIVQERSGPGTFGDSGLASADGATEQKRLESIDATAGNVSKASVEAAATDFATDPSVQRVSLDVKYQVSMSNATERVAAERTRADHNVSGEGVTVAVLDTGVNESHPALEGAEVGERDFTGEGITTDVVGHGTHVAGIVTGNETGSDGMTGIAPDASILDVRVLDSAGTGRTSDIIAGMEYATENADVISMSLSGPPHTVREEDPLVHAVDNATAHGTPVVAAANNYQYYSFLGIAHGTVQAPGTADSAITVGATTDTGEVTPFSGRGPTPYGYDMKPDVVAPGENVRSADADGGYVSHNGTSMATPVVSGTAALLLEEDPTLDPAALRARLTSTADPLGPEWDVYAQGTGEVNASDAIETNVTVTPGTIDYGVFTQPKQVGRQITITNDGPTSRTFEPTVTVEAVNTTAIDSLGSGKASLNQSTVTVGPGESRNLTLTVNTDDGAGIYGGRIQLDDNYTAVFGYTVANNFTVRKEAMGESSVTGDYVRFVPTGNSPQLSVPPLDIVGNETLAFSNGTATVPVVGSEEIAVMTSGRHEATGEPIVLSRTFDVTGEQTVTIDEANTTSVALDVSEIRHREGHLRNESVQVTYSKFFGSRGYGTSMAPAQLPDTSRVWVTEDPNLQLSIGTVLSTSTAPADDPSLNASAIYNIAGSTNGIDGPTRIDVNLSELRRHHVEYFRVNDSQEYDLRIQGVGQFHRTVGRGGSFFRESQVVYQPPDPFGAEFTAREPGAGSDAWEFIADWPELRPEIDRTVTTINKQPLSIDDDWRTFDGAVNVTTVGKRAGSLTRLVDGQPTIAELYVNGERVASDAAFEESARVSTRPAEGDNIRYRAETTNAQSGLSSRTIVEANVTYRSGEDNVPPRIYRPIPLNATRSNYQSNQSATVRIPTLGTAERLDVWWAYGNDSVDLPTRDTSNWNVADIEYRSDREQVAFGTIQAGNYSGPIHLGINATTANGSTYSTLIENATRVKHLPPEANARIRSDVAPAELNVTSVEFDASASEDNARRMAAYRWDFDGDGTIDRTTDSPTTSYVYDQVGSYDPTVTVVDIQDNTDTATMRTVTVEDTTAPTNVVSLNTTTPEVGDTIAFDAAPTTDNWDVTSYEWTFGDSRTASGEHVTHAFASNGSKAVELTTTDPAGNQNTTEVPVFVGNGAPTVQTSGTDVAPGERGTLDASDSSDPNGHELSYEWSQVGGPDATLHATNGEQVDFTAPESGDATLTFEVTVTDAYGASNVQQIEVAVEAETSDDPGSGGGSGGGGGAGGGAPVGGGPAPPVDPDAAVNVTALANADGTVLVNVTDATSGEEVDVDLGGRSQPAITGITAIPDTDGDFDFSVTHAEDSPTGVEDLANSTDAHAVQYATIEHDPIALEEVTYSVMVPRERLTEFGADEDDLRLYRYEDGAWVPKPTATGGSDGDVVSYTATTDGFSEYAIGVVPEASIAVTDADVATSEVATGETVEVLATVENQGGAEGSGEIALEVGDGVAASRTVTLDAGETARISFEYEFSEPGSYDVSLNGTSAGTVQVDAGAETATATQDDEDATDTPAATETVDDGSGAPPPDDGLPLIPLLAGVALIGALVSAGFLFRTRAG